MRKVKSIRGVVVHSTTTGDKVVYIRFQADGREYRERIGVSVTNENGKEETIAEAHRRLRERRREIREARVRGEKWTTPEERRRAAERAAAEAEAAARAAVEARRALLFEEASARFLTRVEAEKDYHAAHRGYFDRLGRVFTGRYLDEIVRRDVLQFLEDRSLNRGAFA